MTAFIPRYKDFQLAERSAAAINYYWALRGVGANARINDRAEILSDISGQTVRKPPPILSAIKAP